MYCAENKPRWGLKLKLELNQEFNRIIELDSLQIKEIAAISCFSDFRFLKEREELDTSPAPAIISSLLVSN